MLSPEMGTGSPQKNNMPSSQEKEKERILSQIRIELSDIRVGSYALNGKREDIYDEPANLEQILTQVGELINSSESLPQEEFAKKLSQIPVNFSTYEDLADFQPIHGQEEPLYIFVDTEEIEKLLY